MHPYSSPASNKAEIALTVALNALATVGAIAGLQLKSKQEKEEHTVTTSTAAGTIGQELEPDYFLLIWQVFGIALPVYYAFPDAVSVTKEIIALVSIKRFFRDRYIRKILILIYSQWCLCFGYAPCIQTP